MKLVLKATLAIAATAYFIIPSAAMAFQPRTNQNGIPDSVGSGSRMEKEYQPPTEGSGSGSPNGARGSGTRMNADDRGSGRKHHRTDRPGGGGRAGHGGQK